MESPVSEEEGEYADWDTDGTCWAREAADRQTGLDTTLCFLQQCSAEKLILNTVKVIKAHINSLTVRFARPSSAVFVSRSRWRKLHLLLRHLSNFL